MTKKFSLEEFKSRGNILYNFKFDYSKAIYINNHTKLIIDCPIHGEFSQTPVDHLYRCGCLKCEQDERRLNAFNAFMCNANIAHSSKYKYHKAVYVDSKTPVTIVCPSHGNFEQRPANHVWGQGCPECVGLKHSTTEEFEHKSRLIHGDFYLYDKVVYNNSYTKVIITCPTHGGFWIYVTGSTPFL
jgi:hypothetical protein